MEDAGESLGRATQAGNVIACSGCCIVEAVESTAYVKTEGENANYGCRFHCSICLVDEGSKVLGTRKEQLKEGRKEERMVRNEEGLVEGSSDLTPTKGSSSDAAEPPNIPHADPPNHLEEIQPMGQRWELREQQVRISIMAGRPKGYY